MSEARAIGRQFAGAAFWSYAGTIGDRVIRFGLFVLIARLVTPAEFGTVAIATILIDASQGLVEASFGTAVIREDEVDEALFDSAFWITCALSFCIALLMLGAAPLAARAFATPALGGVLAALAPVPAIAGIGFIHKARLTKRLGFKALAGRTMGASLIASAVAVGLALGGWGVWALVARALLLAGCQTVAVWLALPWRPRSRVDAAAVRRLLPTSLRLVGTSLANQINLRGFELVAGLWLGAAAVGILRVAGQTIALLIDVSLGPLAGVAIALLARHRGDAAARRTACALLANGSALVVYPAFAGLWAVSDLLLPILFGDRWGGSITLMTTLCLLGPALHFGLLFHAAMFAAGRTDRILRWALIEVALTLMLAIPGAMLGLEWLAALAVLRFYLVIPLGMAWLEEAEAIDRRSLLLAVARPALTAILMALGVRTILLLLPAVIPAPAALALGVAAGILAYAAANRRALLRLRGLAHR